MLRTLLINYRAYVHYKMTFHLKVFVYILPSLYSHKVDWRDLHATCALRCIPRGAA